MLPLERASTKRPAELLMTCYLYGITFTGRVLPCDLIECSKNSYLCQLEKSASGSLPYNESDRGGIETEQSKVHLDVLGHLKKSRVVRF